MAHLLYALPGLLLVDMFAVCPYMADPLFSPDRLKRYS
jgi:ABC-type sulfate transport system permease subunit